MSNNIPLMMGESSAELKFCLRPGWHACALTSGCPSQCIHGFQRAHIYIDSDCYFFFSFFPSYICYALFLSFCYLCQLAESLCMFFTQVIHSGLTYLCPLTEYLHGNKDFIQGSGMFLSHPLLLGERGDCLVKSASSQTVLFQPDTDNMTPERSLKLATVVD